MGDGLQNRIKVISSQSQQLLFFFSEFLSFRGLEVPNSLHTSFLRPAWQKCRKRLVKQWEMILNAQELEVGISFGYSETIHRHTICAWEQLVCVSECECERERERERVCVCVWERERERERVSNRSFLIHPWGTSSKKVKRRSNLDTVLIMASQKIKVQTPQTQNEKQMTISRSSESVIYDIS